MPYTKFQESIVVGTRVETTHGYGIVIGVNDEKARVEVNGIEYVCFRDTLLPDDRKYIQRRYLVVGGKPGTMLTNYRMYIGLKVFCKTDDLEKANQVVKDKYEETGGLIMLIDMMENNNLEG